METGTSSLQREMYEDNPNEEKIFLIDKIIDYRKSKSFLSDKNLFNLFDYLYEQKTEVLKLTLKKLKDQSNE